jgi:predicted transposase YbfD/YdcC
VRELVAILEEIPDNRQQWKIKHSLVEILIISLLAITCNADTTSQIHQFATARADWLKTLLPLKNGIPGRLTFMRVLQTIDVRKLGAAFQKHILNLVGDLPKSHIAIDGKTLNGTYHNKGQKGLVHMVEAWCDEYSVSLGQTRVDEKTNEIIAIPELLRTLNVPGSVITIDAMGCQKKIARQIVKGNHADYLIGLKGNQESMMRELVDYAQTALADPLMADPVGVYKSVDLGHGRIERREYYLFRDLSWFADLDKWEGLNGLLMVRSERTRKKDQKKGEVETRYYITSASGDVERLARICRGHWGIENRLHWSLDVTFHEDDWQTRLQVEAANLGHLRRMSHNLLKLEKTSPLSMPMRRYQCSLDQSYLERVILAAAQSTMPPGDE